MNEDVAKGWGRRTWMPGQPRQRLRHHVRKYGGSAYHARIDGREEIQRRDVPPFRFHQRYAGTPVRRSAAPSPERTGLVQSTLRTM